MLKSYELSYYFNSIENNETNTVFFSNLLHFLFQKLKTRGYIFNKNVIVNRVLMVSLIK